MIEQRLADVLGPGRWSALDPRKVAERLPHLLATLVRGTHTPITSVDASDLGRGDVLKWFASLGIAGSADVYWVSDRGGARMEVCDFFAHYDDLWLAGADDVLVASEAGWLLVLDHEERFTFYPP